MNDEEIEGSVLDNDSIFSVSIRFSIMLLLFIHKRISFKNLQKLLETTSGNLDHHLNKLVEGNFIEKKKIILLRRPLIYVFLTDEGQKEFGQYLSKFRDILENMKDNDLKSKS